MKRYIILCVALIGVLICCCRCTKRIYVPVEKFTERRDTLYRNIIRSDSVYVRDSTVIEHKNDTVRIERWRDRWRNSLIRSDSVRIVRDSVRIPQPYPMEVIKEVPKPLKRWQQILQFIGLIVCVFLIIKICRKWR